MKLCSRPETLSMMSLPAARVVEDVAVPGGAGVAGEHREPDREHGQLRVRVRVKDVRADPTGPQGADASGGAEEHDQSWLAGRFLERGLQLADGVQVGQPLLRPGRGLRRAAAAAGCSQGDGRDERDRRGADHSPTSRALVVWRRQRRRAVRSAISTTAPAAATSGEPRPSAKVRMWPLKRMAKLTIGSSATVA